MLNASKGISTLWMMVIVLIPLTSFPFPFFRTSVSPISALPLLALAVTFLLVSLRKREVPNINKTLFIFGVFALVTILNSFIIVLFSEIDYWKGRTPSQEYLKAIITIVIPILSLYVGNKVGERLKDINIFINLVFISFILPMIFGFLQIINYLLGGVLSGFLYSIQSVLSQGYLFVDRISLLTLEPSWAANLLVCFYIPIFFSAYHYKEHLNVQVKKKATFGLISSIVLLLFTKSAGGIFSLIILSLFMIIKKRRSIFNYKFVISFPFIIILVLFVVNTMFAEVFDRIFRVINTIFLQQSTGIMDGSADVRSTYWVAGIEIFKSNPLLGVGWGNSGFYFSNFIPQSRIYGEVAYYLSDSNNLIPNIKNFHIRILAESGIVGFVLFYSFIVKTIKIIKTKSLDNRAIILTLAVTLSLISWFSEGFSLDTFGFIYPWIQIGLLSGVLVNINKNKISREPRVE